jgi:hypothetical protein
MKKWYEKPLRAVTLEFPASDVATIDVKGIVDETHRGAVNTLCVFSIGYYPGGTAFYQSRLAPHYPGLGERDLLTEALKAAHANGQKVIAYIASIWGGAELYWAHPDWAQRKADGRVTSWDDAYTSVAMCPNSPYRGYLEDVVTEISDNYPVDGFYFDEPSFQSWCSCSYCREKFFAEFHQDLPIKEDWADPVFQKFIAWRYRQITTWRRSLYELVKREDRCIFFQGAFPLAHFSNVPLDISGITLHNPYQERFAVDWYVPLAHAAYLPDSAAIGDAVHFELYRVSVREPLWWYGVSLRYGQSIGKGKQILTLNMMAQTPFDQYGLPETEIQLSIAEILSNSGSPHFARYYPDRVDQQAWEHVYTNLNKAKEIEPYLENRESVKYAAMLYSQSSLDRFDHLKDKPAHLGCLKGFSKALLQEHLLFDIITEAALDRLGEYRVLVLPNTNSLTSEAKAQIRRFVAQGGGLVASYEAGMYDGTGWRQLADDFSELFGLSYSPELPQFGGFDVYMRMAGAHALPVELLPGKLIPTGGIQIDVMPTSAQVVASTLGGAAVHYGPLGEETGSPAILLSQPGGQGRVVYFSLPIGNRYLEFGVSAHRELIAAAVEWAAGDEPKIMLENAPGTIALTGFQQEGGRRLILHLVNSVRDETVRPIVEIPEASNITVKVHSKKSPQKVTSLWKRQNITWEWDGVIISLVLPSVCEAEVILLEYE